MRHCPKICQNNIDIIGINIKIVEMNINFCENNEITNFREIYMGKIAGGLLYRGSYPVFKIDQERDKVYDKLASDAKIACVINLADNEIGLKRIANLVPWYCKLLENDNIIGLDIQFEFDFGNKKENEIFKSKLRQGLIFLTEHNGPYLIHCNAGIDRTGFVAAILEGLLGAKIDEITYDYLLSYGKKFADDNNNELNKNTGKIILDQLNTITNGEINDKNNLQLNIKKYFLEELGLSIKDLEALEAKLTK
jgi:protein tyrosine/serine phosphatase